MPSFLHWFKCYLCHISNFCILYECLCCSALFSDQPLFIPSNADTAFGSYSFVTSFIYGMANSLSLFSYFTIVLGVPSPLFFHMNFRSSFMGPNEIVDYFVKSWHAWPWFSLPVCGHVTSLHLFSPYFIFFKNVF